MQLVLASMFRNSTAYLDRYFAQAGELRRVFPQLRLLLVEGDSTDDTRAALLRRLDDWPGSELVFRDHHGPVFGSVNVPRRWNQISYACNGVWSNIPATATAVIYVESDLIWEVATMNQLLYDTARFTQWPGAAVAPMCFSRGTTRFYDIWGYRRSRQQFSPDPPYIPDYEGPQDLVRLDSCGSCQVMPASLARLVRYDERSGDGPLSLGRSIWAAGGSLWLNPTVKVEHP
jgi:hypothetical protein